MSESKAVVVLGAGGHARVLVDLLRRCGSLEPIALLDRDPALLGERVLGVEVIGDDGALDRFDPEQVELVNGVGSTRSTEARRSLFLHCRDLGFRFATLVHPAAIVARDVVLGEGSQVLAAAVINTGARIAEDCIVNTGALVEHDCRISAHAHVASGAVLAGNVTIHEGAHVGAGATLIQGVTVGSRSVIGAGAVVLRDVEDDAVVAGVPARVIEP